MKNQEARLEPGGPRHPDDFEAVHIGQLQVEQDGFGTVRQNGLQSFEPVGRGNHRLVVKVSAQTSVRISRRKV